MGTIRIISCICLESQIKAQSPEQTITDSVRLDIYRAVRALKDRLKLKDELPERMNEEERRRELRNLVEQLHSDC